MSKQKSKARKYHSRLPGAIHETAAGLHRIGLMDKATMREFDRPKRRSRISLRSTRLLEQQSDIARQDPLTISPERADIAHEVAHDLALEDFLRIVSGEDDAGGGDFA